MSKSSKSPGSSERPTSSAARPYSFRPQDFGAPERVETNASAASDEVASEDQDEATAPKGSGERAIAHAQPLSSGVSHKVARKEEHTILMAVPPPAQENKGD